MSGIDAISLNLPIAAINAQVYLAVGASIFAAGVPIGLSLSQLEGRLNRVLFIVSVVAEVLAVVACCVAVVLSSQVPPSSVPPPLEYLAGVGFGVLLIGCAVTILERALPTVSLAVGLSVVLGSVALVLLVTIAQNVGSLPGKQVQVVAKPRAVDASGSGVWVAHAKGLVTRIDPDSNQAVGGEIEIPLEAGTELFHIAAGLGAVWAMDGDGWIYRIDPELRDEPRKVARVGNEAGEITIARHHLWVNAYSSGLVVRIDPRSPTNRNRKKTFDIGAKQATDIAFGDGWIWVASDSDQRLTMLDPRSGRIVDRIALTGEPNDIAYGHGLVFTTYFYDETLAAIDPETREVLWVAPVGRQPSGIGVLGDEVWVSNYAGDTLTQVDISSGEVAATIDAAAGPTDVSAGSGSVWIVSFDADIITRINSL
jgi:streptogramin lyase